MKGRILLVDDDSAVRSVAAALLESSGYNVVAMSTASDAIALTERREPFDAVVTDLMMPTMSGSEMVQRLRALRPGLPVVYISGYADHEDTDDDRRTTRSLAKPFSPATLRRELEALLASPKTAQAVAA